MSAEAVSLSKIPPVKSGGGRGSLWMDTELMEHVSFYLVIALIFKETQDQFKHEFIDYAFPPSQTLQSVIDTAHRKISTVFYDVENVLYDPWHMCRVYAFIGKTKHE
jgi:hypothetical protein